MAVHAFSEVGVRVVCGCWAIVSTGRAIRVWLEKISSFALATFINVWTTANRAFCMTGRTIFVRSVGE